MLKTVYFHFQPDLNNWCNLRLYPEQQGIVITFLLYDFIWHIRQHFAKFGNDRLYRAWMNLNQVNVFAIALLWL